MPSNAPFVYSATRSKFPGLSEYNQSKMTSPVKGITAIKPARVGYLRAICVQIIITLTLIRSFIINRIVSLTQTTKRLNLYHKATIGCNRFCDRSQLRIDLTTAV